MKKLYTTPEYREFHKRKVNRLSKKQANKRKLNYQQRMERQKESLTFQNYYANRTSYPLPTYAPSDFRLIDNPKGCLEFFREIRSPRNLYFLNNQKLVLITLQDVQKIDYAAISALIAISDDLKVQNINLQGDFPLDPHCREYIIESGFLTHMVDGRNRKFPKSTKSKFIFFEKGSGKLSKVDSKKITELIKDVVEHLTGDRRSIKPIKTVLLEICGNSIEHADTKDQQWLLGTKFMDKKVYFTVTDVGKGILETLFINNVEIMKNLITHKSRLDILKGAFQQKYGSSTQEENRNKGLPAVKSNAEHGTIKNVIVLTNNVILHFDSEEESRTFQKGTPRFKGTLYQWVLTDDCITNSINYYGED